MLVIGLIVWTRGAGDPAPPTITAPPATPPPPQGRVPAPSVGEPWGSVDGLLQFRGNPTHTFYGTGDLPGEEPERLWTHPDGPRMCASSPVGGKEKHWCGTGWTGQPVVWERPDGTTEVIFGAYDKAVHFLDAGTGEETRPPFVTGDIIKGSVTLDPDGYPLLYFGSRDNKLRVVALDRPEPTELWAIDADEHPGIWNNDWDGNPSVVDDILFEGGENGFFFAARLNRGEDGSGRVTVAPEILVKVQGWTDELLASVGDRQASIESSVALFEDRAYFTNSAGRVVGLDVENVEEGEAPVVFDFWAGDDIDASLVIDDEGALYVAAEYERKNARATEVGQLFKLDPTDPRDPIRWSVDVPPRGAGDGGLWATPALGDGVLYASTHPGELLVVRTDTGAVVWRDEIGGHAWSSPVLVGDTLLVSVDCEAGGGLRAYDVSDPEAPDELWDMDTDTGCIESTPAVWNGRIYVGSRDGYFRAFG